MRATKTETPPVIAAVVMAVDADDVIPAPSAVRGRASLGGGSATTPAAVNGDDAARIATSNRSVSTTSQDTRRGPPWDRSAAPVMPRPSAIVPILASIAQGGRLILQL